MSLLLILSFNLSNSFEQTIAEDNEPIVSCEKVVSVSISIAMQGDMLLVTIDDPNDLLDDLEIFNSSNISVLRVENCNSSEYSINLSYLSSGDYNVQVLTALGTVGTEDILIP